MRNETYGRGLPKWTPVLLAVGFLAIAACFETASQDAGIENGYLVSASPTSGNTGLAQTLGEFRIVAANALWEKVDHYHDRYIESGGDWTKNVSVLPLLKEIVVLDPHFSKAYELMGGTILPKTGRFAEGEAVLVEGIRNNPDDWELYREMALLQAALEHEPGKALPYAREGLNRADDDFSRSLMRHLYHTLQERVRTGEKT